VFSTTPNGSGAAIWGAGGGTAADQDGKLFVTTGNGTFDANSGGPDYGDSFVKLDPANMNVLDFFTPFNQSDLSDQDLDLGSSGLLLLPDQPGRIRIWRSARARKEPSTW